MFICIAIPDVLKHKEGWAELKMISIMQKSHLIKTPTQANSWRGHRKNIEDFNAPHHDPNAPK